MPCKLHFAFSHSSRTHTTGSLKRSASASQLCSTLWRKLQFPIIIDDEELVVQHPALGELIPLPFARIRKLFAFFLRGLHVSSDVFHPLIPCAVTTEDSFADDAATFFW